MSEQQYKDFRKLCIKNLNEAEVDRVLNMCGEFAEVISHNVHNNKSGNKNLCMLFPYFNSESDARKAKDGLTAKGYNAIDFANTKRPEPQSPPDASATNIFADFNENNPHGICIRCGENAYYNCARCDDFYCSVDCQKVDWPVHKLHCFPMPELLPSKVHQKLINGKSQRKPVTEAASNQSPNNRSVEATATNFNGMKIAHETNQQNTPRRKMHALSNGGDDMTAPQPSTSSISTTPATINLPITKRIPNDSEVFITYVRSYQVVYIRSVATDDEFTTLVNDVAEAALTAPNLESYPRPKVDNVLAPYDGMYYRGLVLECNKISNVVRVAFIDFGNTGDVPFDKLKVLPDELCQRPRLTLIVKLKNVKENPEAKEAMAMSQYLENICDSAIVMKVHGEGAYIEKNDTVELIEN